MNPHPAPSHRVHRVIAVLVAALLLVSGCGGTKSSSEDPSITIATHDSWAMDKSVMAEFTKETGIKVKIQKLGDAGEMTNKLILTKNAPIADGVFGINNPLAVRAIDNKILQPTRVNLDDAAYTTSQAIRSELVTPVDYSDVCINIDKSWFAKKKLAEPATLDDLTDAKYKGLLVAPGADTSSPGQAFLLATVSAKPDGWQDYWKKLMANDAKIVAGWTEAYETDFTAGGNQGTRPIVVSYSSSPPFTVPEGGSEPTTKALLDTCYRDVEYASVLEGAKHPEEVRKFITFMIGKRFQSQLPEQMYVYPVASGVELPAEWAKWAPAATAPHQMDQAELAKTPELIKTWREIATG